MPDEGRAPVLEQLASRRDEFVGFVARRLGDRARSEDLVQAALTRAAERVWALREEASAVAWFYRCLRRAIVDAYRRRGAEVRALEGFVAELNDSIATLEAAPAGVCRCVLGVAASLKAEYLEALQAIDVDGMAVRAFAHEHGITSSNAAVRVFRAREALRRGLIAACGACAQGGCTDCSCGDRGRS